MLGLCTLKLRGYYLLLWLQIFIASFIVTAETVNETEVLIPITNASVSDSLTFALLSQRLIAAEKSLSEIPAVLINVSSIMTTDSEVSEQITTATLSNIIQSGVSGFLIDLEYDATGKIWRVKDQNASAAFELILSIIDSFIYSRGSVTKLRFFNILINIVNENDTAVTDESLQNLEDVILRFFEQKSIFTKSELESYGKWPSLEQLLLYMFKQVAFQYVNVVSNSTSVVIDSKYIDFIDSDASNYTCPFKVNSSTEVITYKNSYNEDVDALNQAIYCGYKVVISNSFDNLNGTLNLLNSSLIWGWGLDQPQFTNLNYGEYAGFASRFSRGAFYNCACLNLSKTFESDRIGYGDINKYLWWNVDDCYTSKRSLCKKNGTDNGWAISTSSTDFFDLRSNSIANSQSLGCPEDSLFSLPSSPLELASLYDYFKTFKNETLINIIEKEGIWIELNSVSLSTCWVIGDYTTACPYAEFINTRNFIKMVTPLIVTGGCLLIVGFFLKLKKLPIQNDNKQWKRYTRDFSLKSDPDGVPY